MPGHMYLVGSRKLWNWPEVACVASSAIPWRALSPKSC